MKGIYGILCTLNYKIYIGSSVQVLTRIKNHFNELSHYKHKNQLLQNAWNKYGKENFLFLLIEETEESGLEVREQYWMDYYKAYNRDFGYNISETAVILGKFIKSKEWIVTRPNGEDVLVKNIHEFCRNESTELDPSCMLKVARGTRNQHRKYKCRPYNFSKEDWEKTKTRHWKACSGWQGKWLVVYPCGKEEELDSLTTFCKNNNLDQGSLAKVSTGKATHHKGFKCYKVDGPEIQEIPKTEPPPKYKITYPDQETVVITSNLSKFSRDNNLIPKTMHQICNRGWQHKGFKCQRLSADQDIVQYIHQQNTTDSPPGNYQN